MEEVFYWLWLSRVFPYGSEKPRKLLELFETPERIQKALPEELEQIGFLTPQDRRAIQQTRLERAEAIWKECQRLGIQILHSGSPDYPQRLRQLYAPPVVLYARGDLSGLDDEVGITVVGTRRASGYGTRLTGNLCYELSRAGAVIISGCAEGIDTYAHWGALKAGGRTIAVLGCGLDVNYPAANRELKQAILKKGALLTECAPGESPTRAIFPIRNRLLAGLSVGVLVTEAPVRSGSLITAEYAVEQGKDLFCVPPHDIYDLNFSGVVPYLRDGAIPVFSARDVLEEYFALYPHKLNATMTFAQQVRRDKVRPDHRQKQPKQDRPAKTHPAPSEVTVRPGPVCRKWDDSLGEEARRMYDAMTEAPEPLDDIAARAGISAAEAAALATELELMEYISSYSGKRYAKHPIME